MCNSSVNSGYIKCELWRSASLAKIIIAQEAAIASHKEAMSIASKFVRSSHPCASCFSMAVYAW